jgi:hypothetical protein
MSAHRVTLKGDVRVSALSMHPYKSVTYFPYEREPVKTQRFL